MRGFKSIRTCFLAVTLLLSSIKAQTVTSAPTAAPPPTSVTPIKPKICDNCTCSGNGPIGIDCVNVGFTEVPADDLVELAELNIRVTKIDLSYNNITHVRTGDFHSIGARLNTIDLRWNQILTIEEEAFASDHLPRLDTLQLGNNQLQTLPLMSLRGLSLTTMDLSYNLLDSVPKALAQAESIQMLYLNNNHRIRRLANDSLDGIKGVQTLDMSACSLTSFESCFYEQEFFQSLNYLYLDQNHFSVIEPHHFACPNDPFRLSVLQFLSMRYSGITRIERKAFLSAFQLRRLLLGGNNLGIFKGRVFSGLEHLNELDLSDCNITDLKGVLFRDSSLHNLFLGRNNIRKVHTRDFRFLNELRQLDLSNSNIEEIDEESPFEHLGNLDILTLSDNKLDDRSIPGLGKTGQFYFLDLTNNNLTRIPNLPEPEFPHLRDLLLGGNSIRHIHTSDLVNMTNLHELILKNNDIQHIEEDAFLMFPYLSNLDLDSMSLTKLPIMNFPMLHTLHVQYGRLESLPEDLCQQCPGLKLLEVQNNSLSTLPRFRGCEIMFIGAANNKISTLYNDTLEGQSQLTFLQLDHNQLESFPDGFFRDTILLEFLYLRGNRFSTLPGNVFQHMPLLVRVDLGHNRLTHLEDGLFQNQTVQFKVLELDNNQLTSFGTNVLSVNSTIGSLNLSSNNLEEVNFPRGGLLDLVELFLEENFGLLQVPDVADYPNVTNVKYSYAYHCCIWREYATPHHFVDHSLNDTGPPTEIPPAPPIHQLGEDECIDGVHTEETREGYEEIAEIFNLTIIYLPGCKIQIIENGVEIGTSEEKVFNFVQRGGVAPPINHTVMVTCSPQPDDLTPCDNLMDPWVLRVLVWVVWVLTLLGNGTVLFIAIAAKEKLEVYQFLICCLAFADFCTGVYLAFLAAVDIRTFGTISFYQSALHWQMGAGCNAAGFIAVFASELSVFILVVLTLERVHTIANTFNKNETGKMKIAVGVAIIGVLVSALLAALPLVGINSYSRVAVCLPYVTDEWTDRMYIGLLLTLNLIAFLIILCSYLYIFRAICKSPAAQHKKKDITIAAAKIALLIVTAFICWVPIVIVGYLALAGVETVTTEQAKYLVVLVYPLNACLNPFIYALFTRQCRQRASSWYRRRSKRNSLPNSKRFQLKRGSSAFLSTANSPHINPTAMHLINLRQSKRSNSLSIQFVSQNTATPPIRSPPSLSPPPGVYMGRRASLPAAFGSSIHTTQLGHADSHQSSLTSNNSAADVNSLPFRFAPGFGPNNSQPNLNEEEEVASPCNLTNSLGGSQDSATRQLPGIPEEQEENISVCSSDSEDYCDAQDNIKEEEIAALETVELDSEIISSDLNCMLRSSTRTGRSLSPSEAQKIILNRESMDSAYSGGASTTPVDLHHCLSPTHSCSLSRESESFSSYDIAVSDTEEADHENSITPHVSPRKCSRGSPTIAFSNLDTCLDSQVQIKDSLKPHNSRHSHINLKTASHLSTKLESPSHLNISNSQISIVGSETSV